MFEDWYALYPRKMARKDAEKAWNKLTELDKSLAIKEISNHVKYWKLKGISKEFIPYPASWLNGYRFLDELDFEESKPKRPALPWYSSEELTLAKAKELGLTPYAGESYAQLRQRISTQISRQATV